MYAIRSYYGKTISDDLPRPTVALHQFPEEFQCGFLVPALGDYGVKHFALMVDSSPQVMPLAVDFHEHLVDMPAPVRERAQLFDAFPPDFRGEHRTETMPPEPDRLVTNIA